MYCQDHDCAIRLLPNNLSVQVTTTLDRRGESATIRKTESGFAGPEFLVGRGMRKANNFWGT
jgi:hypothetical protein